MSPPKYPRTSASCSSNLTVPELEQSKTALLNILASVHTRRSYKHAIEEFIAWYCSIGEHLQATGSSLASFAIFSARLAI
jgi:hypothetical protein